MTWRESYLFSTIADKVEAYTKAHPDQEIIRMGIGDVTQPLCPAVIQPWAQQAVAEMGVQKTFHGYGPEQAMRFKAGDTGILPRKAAWMALGEIFYQRWRQERSREHPDLFSADNTVCVPDPVYPGVCGYKRNGGPAHRICRCQRKQWVWRRCRRQG